MANNTKNTKNTFTQAEALRILIDYAAQHIPTEVIEKAEELYAAKTKKYDRAKTISKERRLNESLVEPIVELIKENPGEMINATWINANFNHPEVRSPQKARVIAELAIEAGMLEKYQEKGRTYYKVTE